jgi:cytochrome c biogenesis protein CcmG, thiol:disulfide interchange protein DsbE
VALFRTALRAPKRDGYSISDRTMLRICALLWMALLACVAVAEPRPAPPLTATQLDGNRFSTTDHAGKVIVVNFWATWCGPCREEMPALDAFYQRYRQHGLEMIAISLDEAGDAAKVRQVAQGYQFPVALSSQARYKGFGRIWRVPMTFVIDRNGRLREDLTEKVAQVDLAFLESRIAPLLGP